MSGNNSETTFQKSIGTWEVIVAGVALVVAASTLVSDFTGFFTLGAGFVLAIIAGFGINLLLGLSAADLSVAYPRAGALYDYARAVFRGRTGRFLGTLLGLIFIGGVTFAVSGETVAGAASIQSLINPDLPIELYIVGLSVLAVIPNILGIRTTAWVSAGLLVLMLGIRWFFGMAGFLGMNNLGSWHVDNFAGGAGVLDLFGNGGILTAGLTLAVWSFIGIEFASSLAEEVKEPKRSMPLGIVIGLVLILLTSLVMGLGVTGTQPLSAWQELMAGDAASGGNAPQNAVGLAMFGSFGFLLMSIASVSATLGSVTIAYTGVARVIFSIARDRGSSGIIARFLGKTSSRFGTPVNATIVTFFLFILPALFSSQVIEWLYTAAYIWLGLYVVFHVLALVNRLKRPEARGAFNGVWFVPMTIVGIVATVLCIYIAFAGSHMVFGTRALAVLAVTLTIAWFVTRSKGSLSPQPRIASAEIEPSLVNLDH